MARLNSVMRKFKNSGSFSDFWENMAVLFLLHSQDRVSGKGIGLAKENHELYYLENSIKSSTIKNNLSLSCFSTANRKTIWLYHFRLGHPSFGILKIMFPSLFNGLGVNDFHCDVCELAKHKRASFPPSSKRSSVPFYLIHSDIWGPSKVPNVSGSRWFISFIDDCTRVSWIFLLKLKSDVSSIVPNFHNRFKTNLVQKLRDFDPIMPLIILIKYCPHTFKKKELFMNPRVLIPRNKMALLKEKNGHLPLFFSIKMSRKPIGRKRFLHQHTSLIDYLQRC